MRSFRALVVDDDPDIRSLALGVHDPERGIDVSVASGLEEAEERIAHEFFNVAFVDLQLEKGPRPNVDGQTVLQELRRVRPACRRILLTQYPTVYREELFRLLDPEAPSIDAAVDKDDFAHLFVEYLEAEAAAWLAVPVLVRDVEALTASLQRKRIVGAATLSAGPTQLSVNEVDYVVSSLFGQAVPRAPSTEGDPDAVADVAIELLQGGKSRSIVGAARPRPAAGGQGIVSVVKIGPREDAVEEVRRYERFVRFRVSLHQRVELLGHAFGDTIGAICYSFAARAPEEITDLQSLFDASDERAFDVIQFVLGDTAPWHSEDLVQRDLAGFFSRAYGLEARRVVHEAHEFARRRASHFSARKAGDELVFEGGKLELPTDSDVGAGLLRGDYLSSIVHGDLNASNVIVSERGDAILIDFRHTTRGPRSLDFAALQASIRLSQEVWREVAGSVVNDHAIEELLWNHEWPSGEWWPRNSPNDPPYWARVSAALLKLSFETLDGLTRREYAATTLLYALRIFRVAALPAEARLRLLVWISATLRALRD